MNHSQEDKNICLHCSDWIGAIKSIRNFTDEELKVLERPEKVFTCTIPVAMDDGSIQRFNGYRVQYNTALGPAKGGLRFHQDVDLEEAQTLAFLMSLKTSLAGLPLGGGKGGVEVDVETLSETEKENLTRSFTRQLKDFIGPETDIPAPDVNTNAQVMDWIVDEYSKAVGSPTPSIVTGKSLKNGGSLGREKATSLGGAFVLRALLKKHLDKEPQETSIAIQGYGNVGKNIAQILQSWNYKVVALSNAKKAIYNESGLNVENKNTLEEITDEYSEISNEALLELDVDVLIPAAISDQITSDNVNDIKAKVILEMANAPISQDADHTLHDKNVLIIPDILANAGGVIVSYYEWVQNQKSEKWTEEDVNEKLEKQILDALQKTEDHQKEHESPISLRYAAYGSAIDRIFTAEKERNWL